MPAGTLDLIVLAERDVDAIEKVEVEDDPDKLGSSREHNFSEKIP